MKLRDSLAENKSIRLQAEAETWQDAVKIGVDLLVAADVVEPRYYQAILDGVEQFGPYFVIAPGLAMPHGRPEEGVKKTGFSLVTLKKPLEFNPRRQRSGGYPHHHGGGRCQHSPGSGHHADRQPV